jgi:hypothetical protein
MVEVDGRAVVLRDDRGEAKDVVWVKAAERAAIRVLEGEPS